MNTALIACRVSSWLMNHGFLRGHASPVRVNWLIRDMTTQDPEGMAAATAEVKRTHGKAGGKQRWLILEKMCHKHGISLEKRASAPVRNTGAATEKWRQHVMSDAFLQTYEWRKLRMQALKRDGARCACCGATPDHGVALHVDHIKPRKLFPNLALTLDNLQILCEDCNHGKGNWDMTDWRNPSEDDKLMIAAEAERKKEAGRLLAILESRPWTAEEKEDFRRMQLPLFAHVSQKK